MLTDDFDSAFRELAAARIAYEDEPRDPQRIAALSAARTRLEAARREMHDERTRLGIDTPWRVLPATTDEVKPPPLWSVAHGSGA